MSQDASKLEHLAKENYILKKAVLVQSQRLTEAQASLSELPALRAQVWLRRVSCTQSCWCLASAGSWIKLAHERAAARCPIGLALRSAELLAARGPYAHSC